MRKLLLFVCLLAGLRAAEISRIETGTSLREGACALARRASAIEATEPQIYARFTASRIARGETLRVEWVDPAGEVAEASDYEQLPSATAVCIVNALQVGGFAPATRPGNWTVRVLAGGRVLGERSFEIRGRPARVAVKVAESGPGGLVLDTWGAEPDTTINLARYREQGGWEYVAVVLASRREANRLWANPGPLEPGEYLVILRNPDGEQSLPARFVIAAGQGFRRPFPDGEIWRVTQRPYGAYSHYGRALHAWDFAPVNGRYVAAMRAGTVFAHDLRLGQTPGRRLFGNYISIRHDDGTWSHYAHLKTGTFRVRTGQRVEAGQVLAEVGNSGYSFGRHLHVHVTRSPSIAAPSIPISFAPSGGAGPALTRAEPPATSRPQALWTGEAGFAQWWSRLLRVPKGTQRLAVRLEWDDPAAELDLYLVSPRGEWIRAEGKEVAVPQPLPGAWRVSVQSVKGDARFRLLPEITPQSP